MELKDILVGKTIEKIFVRPDGEILTLILGGGQMVTLVSYGDCCSHTWFEEILGFNKHMRGSVIVDVEDLSLPDPVSDDSWEYLQDYGFSIKTTQGIVKIIYRNSSNGYYGGWYEVIEPCEPAESWTEVEGDW